MKFCIPILLCFCPVWTLPRLPDSGSISSRIIGGSRATPGEYPWLAAIYVTKSDERFFCGGSIYHAQWILTAAQCVYEATSVSVQVGSTTLQGSDPNRVTVTATKFFWEPRFDPVSLKHDIALIKLDAPLTLNNYIKELLILESMSPLYPGAKVDVVGWGQTSDTGDLSNDLNHVTTTIMGQPECESYFADQILGSMVCAGGGDDHGFCLGDTGGPLIGQSPALNLTIQVGIASFLGDQGCLSDYPKGYTRVDAYQGWLATTVKEN